MRFFGVKEGNILCMASMASWYSYINTWILWQWGWAASIGKIFKVESWFEGSTYIFDSFPFRTECKSSLSISVGLLLADDLIYRNSHRNTIRLWSTLQVIWRCTAKSSDITVLHLPKEWSKASIEKNKYLFSLIQVRSMLMTLMTVTCLMKKHFTLLNIFQLQSWGKTKGGSGSCSRTNQKKVRRKQKMINGRLKFPLKKNWRKPSTSFKCSTLSPSLLSSRSSISRWSQIKSQFKPTSKPIRVSEQTNNSWSTI